MRKFISLQKFSSIVFLMFGFFQSFSQDDKFIGKWEGRLELGVSLRMVVHILKNADGTYTSILDSPDQSAFGIPTDETTIKNNELHFAVNKISVSYTGKLVNDTTIEGTFSQNADVDLKLVKSGSALPPVKRPQTPQPPFPYKVEEVEYDNAATGLHYGATITIPPGEGPFPAALLITGSGAQNRDEEILLHKPFAVIADYLSRAGYVVMRVDDRGMGKSTGNFATSTTLDFSRDVNASLDFLKARKEVNSKKLGLIGHSEGGMIAPMVASGRKDVDFIILLAGPGEKILDLMAGQNAALLKSAGVPASNAENFKVVYRDMAGGVIAAHDIAEAKNSAKEILDRWIKNTDSLTIKNLGFISEEAEQKYIDQVVPVLYSPWFRYFLAFDPQPYLQSLHCKVLALAGSRDIQVEPTGNLAGIEAALKKSKVKKYKVQEFPDLNHLFQPCMRCDIKEYGQLEESFSPEVLKVMGDWLKEVEG